jgi:hypothetical protein
MPATWHGFRLHLQSDNDTKIVAPHSAQKGEKPLRERQVSVATHARATSLTSRRRRDSAQTPSPAGKWGTSSCSRAGSATSKRTEGGRRGRTCPRRRGCPRRGSCRAGEPRYSKDKVRKGINREEKKGGSSRAIASLFHALILSREVRFLASPVRGKQKKQRTEFPAPRPRRRPGRSRTRRRWRSSSTWPPRGSAGSGPRAFGGRRSPRRRLPPRCRCPRREAGSRNAAGLAAGGPPWFRYDVSGSTTTIRPRT